MGLPSPQTSLVTGRSQRSGPDHSLSTGYRILGPLDMAHALSRMLTRLEVGLLQRCDSTARCVIPAMGA